jgi:hypothetical protein
MSFFDTSTGENDIVGTFGWVLITGAFLILIMVANNSWPWVWAKIQQGIPQPGQGNTIVPTPPEASAPFTLTPETTPQGPPSGTIVPTPSSTVPQTQVVQTVNGVVQSSAPGNMG